MTDLVVVGGGIAGLTVAHEAAAAGLRVELWEAGERLGGLLRRGELAGIPVDVGAESFATRNTAVAELAAEVAPELQLVRPDGAGAHLAVAGDSGLIRAALPARTVLGIPADPGAPDVVRILGPTGAAAVAAERQLAPLGELLREGAEPSLADLVARRCGTRLRDRLVDPLCRSVYSQPASRLTLSRVHPQLWHEALRRGSLVAGAAEVAVAQRAGSAVGGIAGGMWQLIDHLVAAARERGVLVRTGRRVESLAPTSGGVRIRVAGSERTVSRVVLATGPAATGALLGAPSRTAGSVRVVAALVRSNGLDEHPVGSGVIVGATVPGAAKALTHANAKWGWLAAQLPAGHHVIRMSAREAAGAGLDTRDEIAAQISLLTGIAVRAGDIVDRVSIVHEDAIAGAPVPQPATPRIRLAGAAVAGTGLAAVVPQASALAEQLVTDAQQPIIEARSIV